MRAGRRHMGRHAQRPKIGLSTFEVRQIEIQQHIPRRNRAEVEPQRSADEPALGKEPEADLFPTFFRIVSVHLRRTFLAQAQCPA